MRIAVVQPRLVADGDPAGNVGAALEAVAQSSAGGARLVLFPEAYPGPMTVTQRYDSAGPIARAAHKHQVIVCWSAVERSPERRWQMVVHVDRPDSGELVRYARAHPATGDVHPTLNGASLTAGRELVVFDALGVRWGVMVCSELWLPEVARVLAVRGAEVLLAPAGGAFGAVAANWQLIACARAIENQCHVVLTQSLYDDELGAALIAGPEGPVRASVEPGVVFGDLDLARARWLRDHDDSMAVPKPFRSLPGLLRARRPALYGELAEPAAGLYDYETVTAQGGVQA